MRTQLLTEAGMVAQAVNTARVMTLSGAETDLASADYQRLKEQLTLIRSVNPSCRFIYLMGQRPDKSIYIFVDSEPSESKDYSPPGQTYDEISDGSLRVFTTRQSATVGPETGRWGVWVSALVPLLDPRTRMLIAVLGMDVDARAWNRGIAEHCVAPVSVTALILIILGVSLQVQRRGALEKQRLAASEEEYRTLFDASHDANMLEDKSGFLNCNPATLQMFGCPSRDAFVSTHPADWSPPTQPDGRNSREAAGKRIDAAFATGEQSFEWTYQRTDGTIFPAEVLLSRMEYRGKIVLLATVRDITARKQAEIVLSEQQAWKQAILETSQTGFIIVSVDSRKIVDVNRTAARIIGAPREAIVGKVCHQFICPAEKGQCPICDLGQPMENRERVLLTADGRKIPILKTATVMTWNGQSYVLDSFVDISERVAMESALRQQHTLTSIGTLARGMAHEVNNPIMGIMNFAQLIKDRAVDNASLAGFADEILAESQRVATMTHGLLSFTHQQEVQPVAPATAADLVGSVLPQSAKAAQERGIELTCDLPADLPAVSCRRSQIGQVLAALLTNAMEAWGEDRALDAGRPMLALAPAPPEAMQGKRLAGGKKIIVSARDVVNSEPSSVITDHSISCRRLRLTVEDNGPGILAEIRERVFEPFFTTKDRTRHSGLGLWIGRSIIQELGGELNLESPSTARGPGEEGQWTRFHIDLPVEERKTIGV
jgi:PAS domain S-box-containing protein